MRANLVTRPRRRFPVLPLLFAAAALALSGVAGLRGQPAASGTVRVMLREDAPSVEVRPDAPAVITDFDTGARHPLTPGQTYVVRPRDGGLRFGTWDLGAQIRYAPAAADALAALDGARYRGTLLLQRRDAGGLQVINELGVEEYLYSVLGKEMSAEWPLEALRAQAVISRTYALKNLGRYEDQGYDLLDDVRSQVYRGVETEDPRTVAAVHATAGQVLAYRGRLVSTHFHSCCGGHTSALETAWSGSGRTRPLQGVRDSFCAGTPHFRWSKVIPAQALLGALPDTGKNPKQLKGISIGRRDSSGYVRTLKVATDSGTVRVRASELRRRLGFELVRSTLLTKIAVKKDKVQLSGKGWGHGVGLCQWGARNQAKRGRKYRNILKFYYPGAKVAKWKS